MQLDNSRDFSISQDSLSWNIEYRAAELGGNAKIYPKEILRLDIFSYCKSYRKWINVQTSDETLRPRTVEYLVPRLKSLVHLHHTVDFPHKPETGEEANCTCK